MIGLIGGSLTALLGVNPDILCECYVPCFGWAVKFLFFGKKYASGRRIGGSMFADGLAFCAFSF